MTTQQRSIRYLLIAALGMMLSGLWPFVFGYGGAPSLLRAEEHAMPGVLTRRPAAPEFPKGFTWWNTDRPLTFQGDLAGRVVVLDFWTYCCINCIHELANLHEAESHLKGQPVVIVGVHSNKFTNEGEAANIREAILRYRIQHPVVVDEVHRIWDAFGVSSWPTLVFIDSAGHVAEAIQGEVPPAQIEQTVQRLLEEGRRQGTLAARPPVLRPESMVPSASGLAFPGKAIADPAGNRLFIADSNHNRIVAADPAGRLLQVIGTGEEGRADGPLDRASFLDPQGMAFDAARGLLYVADHGNHLIRRVDLKAGRVETVLGTGRQVYDRGGGGRGLSQGLNSPWDLELDERYLYIAMAGTHQIWRMDLGTRQAEAWVGSGREGIGDGPGLNAALAQPSGLAKLGDWLYFADSEVSALRRVRLRDGDVETLIGHGLFDFGDSDGALGRARLQHPLGVATDGRELFLADTYNHKLKQVNLETRTIRTLAGTGKPGTGDPAGALALYEPGGLAWLGGRLYIADTNNQRVVVLDPQNGAWHELSIRESRMTDDEEKMVKGYPIGATVDPAATRLVLELEPAMVEGFHVNTAAPQTVVLWEPEGQGGGLLQGEDHRLQCSLKPGKIPMTLEVPLAAGRRAGGRLIVDFHFASCTDQDQGLCKPEQRRWDVTWKAAAPGGAAPPHPIRLVGGAIGLK